MEEKKLIDSELLIHLAYFFALLLSYNELLIPPEIIYGFSINTDTGFISPLLLVITIFMVVNSINTLYKNKGDFKKKFNKELNTSKTLIKIQNEEILKISGKKYDTESVNLSKNGKHTINAGKYLNKSGFWTKDIKIDVSWPSYYFAASMSLLNTLKKSNKRSWVIHATTIFGIALGIYNLI